MTWYLYLLKHLWYIISGALGETVADNVSSSMVPSTNTSINFSTRHEDVRKSSSSDSSSPIMPGLTGGIPGGGLGGSFLNNFLPTQGIPGGQHLIPPPLLLMPSVARPPTCSPPNSASSSSAMQPSNKLLVRPHPHRFMPSSSHIPSLPLSSNPYFNIQENLENYGKLSNDLNQCLEREIK